MITELEIGKLKALTQKVDVRWVINPDFLNINSFSRLEDFLQDDEIEIIKQNSSQYENLTNRVIVPLHNRMVIAI